jgi:hypothetical protein
MFPASEVERWGGGEGKSNLCPIYICENFSATRRSDERQSALVGKSRLVGNNPRAPPSLRGAVETTGIGQHGH